MIVRQLGLGARPTAAAPGSLRAVPCLHVSSSRGVFQPRRRFPTPSALPSDRRSPASDDDDDDEAMKQYAASYGSDDEVSSAAAAAAFWDANAQRAARAAKAADRRKREVAVQQYLSSRGLGAIDEIRDAEFMALLEELEEADIGNIEQRVALEGGDLESDWAAIEASKSTTARAKSGAGASGSGGSPSSPTSLPVPTASLLQPPSNPKVERMRRELQEMRRSRRLFKFDADGSMYDSGGSSGSDSDGDGYGASARQAAVPLRPAAPPRRMNPFIGLPDPKSVREAAEDLDDDLDLDFEALARQQELGLPEDLLPGPSRQRGTSSGGSSRAVPKTADEVNAEFGNRMVKALRKALTDDLPGLEQRPSAPPGTGGASSGSRKRGPTSTRSAAAGTSFRSTQQQWDDQDDDDDDDEFGGVLRGGMPSASSPVAGRDDDYDFLMGMLDELEGQPGGAAGSLSPAGVTPSSSGSGSSAKKKGPISTTALLRGDAGAMGSVARPQRLQQPQAPRQAAAQASSSSAFGSDRMLSAGPSGAFADSSLAFIDSWFDDGNEDGGVEPAAPQQRTTAAAKPKATTTTSASGARLSGAQRVPPTLLKKPKGSAEAASRPRPAASSRTDPRATASAAREQDSLFQGGWDLDDEDDDDYSLDDDNDSFGLGSRSAGGPNAGRTAGASTSGVSRTDLYEPELLVKPAGARAAPPAPVAKTVPPSVMEPAPVAARAVAASSLPSAAVAAAAQPPPPAPVSVSGTSSSSGGDLTSALSVLQDRTKADVLKRLQGKAAPQPPKPRKGAPIAPAPAVASASAPAQASVPRAAAASAGPSAAPPAAGTSALDAAAAAAAAALPARQSKKASADNTTVDEEANSSATPPPPPQEARPAPAAPPSLESLYEAEASAAAAAAELMFLRAKGGRQRPAAGDADANALQGPTPVRSKQQQRPPLAARAKRSDGTAAGTSSSASNGSSDGASAWGRASPALSREGPEAGQKPPRARQPAAQQPLADGAEGSASGAPQGGAAGAGVGVGARGGEGPAPRSRSRPLPRPEAGQQDGGSGGGGGDSAGGAPRIRPRAWRPGSLRPDTHIAESQQGVEGDSAAAPSGQPSSGRSQDRSSSSATEQVPAGAGAASDYSAAAAAGLAARARVLAFHVESYNATSTETSGGSSSSSAHTAALGRPLRRHPSSWGVAVPAADDVAADHSRQGADDDDEPSSGGAVSGPSRPSSPYRTFDRSYSRNGVYPTRGRSYSSSGSSSTWRERAPAEHVGGDRSPSQSRGFGQADRWSPNGQSARYGGRSYDSSGRGRADGYGRFTPADGSNGNAARRHDAAYGRGPGGVTRHDDDDEEHGQRATNHAAGSDRRFSSFVSDGDSAASQAAGSPLAASVQQQLQVRYDELAKLAPGKDQLMTEKQQARGFPASQAQPVHPGRPTLPSGELAAAVAAVPEPGPPHVVAHGAPALPPGSSDGGPISTFQPAHAIFDASGLLEYLLPDSPAATPQPLPPQDDQRAWQHLSRRLDSFRPPPPFRGFASPPPHHGAAGLRQGPSPQAPPLQQPRAQPPPSGAGGRVRLAYAAQQAHRAATTASREPWPVLAAAPPPGFRAAQRTQQDDGKQQQQQRGAGASGSGAQQPAVPTAPTVAAGGLPLVAAYAEPGFNIVRSKSALTAMFSPGDLLCGRVRPWRCRPEHDASVEVDFQGLEQLGLQQPLRVPRACLLQLSGGGALDSVLLRRQQQQHRGADNVDRGAKQQQQQRQQRQGWYAGRGSSDGAVGPNDGDLAPADPLRAPVYVWMTYMGCAAEEAPPTSAREYGYDAYGGGPAQRSAPRSPMLQLRLQEVLPLEYVNKRYLTSTRDEMRQSVQALTSSIGRRVCLHVVAAARLGLYGTIVVRTFRRNPEAAGDADADADAHADAHRPPRDAVADNDAAAVDEDTLGLGAEAEAGLEAVDDDVVQYGDEAHGTDEFEAEAGAEAAAAAVAPSKRSWVRDTFCFLPYEDMADTLAGATQRGHVSAGDVVEGYLSGCRRVWMGAGFCVMAQVTQKKAAPVAGGVAGRWQGQ